MWPNNFEYVRANSVAEAINAISGHENAKLLAGGHSLLPAMKLRLSQPSMLVDIGRVADLKGIKANGSLMIGALSTHAEVASNASVKSMAAALAQAASIVGDPAVRNFGTLGGNIAHADPASDPPTVLMAYDAIIHVQGKGGMRNINAGDFFVDLFATSLKADEIVTSIEIRSQSSMKSAYAKMPHPASRYAVVGVCVSLTVSGGTCSSAHVAVGGATIKAVRCPKAEAALTGSTLNAAALDAAAKAVQSDIANTLTGDMTFPKEYRQAMAGVYLKRAVRAAMG